MDIKKLKKDFPILFRKIGLNDLVYLDNAATSQKPVQVVEAVKDFYLEHNANVHRGIHTLSEEASGMYEDARKKVARFINAIYPEEIIFTAGATESNNMTIQGVVNYYTKQTNRVHIITTKIEHSSILECFRNLEKRGLRVTYLPVNSGGIVDLTALKKALRPETVLVSIQYTNNEIGAIQPIREISKILRHHNLQTYKLPNFKTHFHTDASQAPCYLDCSVEKLGVDLLTLDGHKIYGPKGIGALYIRRNTAISPISFGGGQEKGLRPGTENIPLIAGLAKALEICSLEMKKEPKRISVLRDWLTGKILKQFPKIILNGDMANRLPNNINISIPDIDTEFLVLQLDAKGISVSTKSACIESDKGSYVVTTLGGDSWKAKHTLRITLGRFTKKSDIEAFLKKFSEIIKK